MTAANQGEEKTYCYYHPQVETSLRCSNCGKPICPRDMVYTPVGLKCKECGRPTWRARGIAKPSYYFKALGYGLAAAVVGGMVVGEIRHFIPFGGFLVALGLGYVVGEAVSRAVHRRSDTPFEVIAGAMAFVATVVAGYFGNVIGLGGLGGGFVISPFGLLYAGLAVVVAVSRLRS